MDFFIGLPLNYANLPWLQFLEWTFSIDFFVGLLCWTFLLDLYVGLICWTYLLDFFVGLFCWLHCKCMSDWQSCHVARDAIASKNCLCLNLVNTCHIFSRDQFPDLLQLHQRPVYRPRCLRPLPVLFQESWETHFLRFCIVIEREHLTEEKVSSKHSQTVTLAA